MSAQRLPRRGLAVDSPVGPGRATTSSTGSSTGGAHGGPLVSPVGSSHRLYGQARPEFVVGAHELSRSNPMRAVWSAAAGLDARPRPLSPDELALRRAPLRSPGLRASHVGYPKDSFVLVVNEELARSESRGRAPGSRCVPNERAP